MDGLTDSQLRLAVTDPGFGPQHWAKLTPDEQARAQQILMGNAGGSGAGPQAEAGAGGAPRETLTSKLGTMLGDSAKTVGSMGVGAAKGLAETTTRVVGAVPGVTRATNAIGNKLGSMAGNALYGESGPEVSPDQTQAALQRNGTAEKVGAGLEQAAEYMVPAGAMRKGAIEGLVRYGIPDTAGPGAMKIMNKLASIIGRSAGEAGSAAAVSAAHGDDDPVATGLMAGAIPPVTSAAAWAAPAIKKVLPVAAGGAAFHAMTGLTGGLGFGAGLGTYGAARGAVDKSMTPARMRALQQFVKDYLPTILRGGLGTEEDARTGPQRTPFAGGQ